MPLTLLIEVIVLFAVGGVSIAEGIRLIEIIICSENNQANALYQ